MSLKEKFYEYVSKKQGRRKFVEVDLAGETVKIWFTPVTVIEGEKIRTLGRVSTGVSGEFTFNAGLLNLHLVIEKAEDEEGKKLFDFGDLPTLQQMDEAIIMKIVSAISPVASIQEKKSDSQMTSSSGTSTPSPTEKDAS
jgi:hypothetical protein